MARVIGISECDICGKELKDVELFLGEYTLCERHRNRLRRIVECIKSDDGEVVVRAKGQSNLS